MGLEDTHARVAYTTSAEVHVVRHGIQIMQFKLIDIPTDEM